MCMLVYRGTPGGDLRSEVKRSHDLPITDLYCYTAEKATALVSFCEDCTVDYSPL